MSHCITTGMPLGLVGVPPPGLVLHRGDLAFNKHLLAYDVRGKEERCGTHTTLQVAQWWQKGEFPSIPPLMPSTYELSHKKQPRAEETRALWVGVLAPQAGTPDYSRLLKTAPQKGSIAAKEKPKRIEDLTQKAVYSDDENTIRIVVKLKAGLVNLRYYGLYAPDNDGLCQTYPVPADEVFFFREFWDDTEEVDEINGPSSVPQKIKEYVQQMAKNPWVSPGRKRKRETIYDTPPNSDEEAAHAGRKAAKRQRRHRSSGPSLSSVGDEAA